jgi:dCTP deaminase
MILPDREIQKAIRDGRLVINPEPDPSQYDSSALDLRVGDDFRRWRNALRAPGTRHHIDLDRIDLANIIDLSEPLEPNSEGVVVIAPGDFVLVRTLEWVQLPLTGKLAARVEGRSKQARLGLAAHITAPTIHAGFRGKITLEIINHGPFHLEAYVNQSRLCQLIFEEVRSIPERGGSPTFSEQETPLGGKKPKKG